VKLWDLRRRREACQIAANDTSSVGFAPDGRLIVTGGSRDAVQLFDPATGRLLRRFSYRWCRAQCALFAADGETLLCGGHIHTSEGKVGRVLRWNLKTGRHRRPLLGVKEDVGFISFSPDGRHLATGGDEGTAWLWDLKTGRVLATFKCRAKCWRVVAFSPDGHTLAVTAGSAVELWDPQTLKKRRLLRGHKGTVWGICFTPDGRLVSCGRDGTVRVWDVTAARERACFDWEIGPVNNVAVAPDGLTAAAGSCRGDIVIWDVDAG
jgi:WD40 repeat protein